MKKMMLVALLSIACLSASAQLNIGIRGGWSGAQINFENATGTDDILEGAAGYQLGAYVRLGLGNLLYVEPGVSFLKSSVQEKADSEGLISAAMKMEYGSIDVPVMVGAQLKLGSLARVRAYVGPVANYITSDIKGTVEGNLGGIGGAVEHDWKADQALTFKGQIGAGVDVLFVTLDVNYQIGLTDVTFQEVEEGFKANSFNVLLGIRF